MANAYANKGKERFEQDWANSADGSPQDYHSRKKMEYLFQLFDTDISDDAVVVDVGCGPTPLSTYLVNQGKHVHRLLIDYADNVYALQGSEPDAPVAGKVDLNIASRPTTDEPGYGESITQFRNGLKYANELKNADTAKDDLYKADVMVLGSILNYIPYYKLIPFLDKHLRTGGRLFIVNTMYGYKDESWLSSWGDGPTFESFVTELKKLGYDIEYPSTSELGVVSQDFEIVAVKR